MKMTNKERLLNVFDEAIEKAGKDSCIVVTVRTRVACTDYNELIILTRDTWAFKKDYYSKAYNDDLVLNNAEFVSILSVSLVDNVGIMNIKRMELFNRVSNKEKLIDLFKSASINKEVNYICVRVEIKDSEGLLHTERIVFNKREFDYKLKYYLNSYDDDLRFNLDKDVRIISLVLCGDEKLENVGQSYVF